MAEVDIEPVPKASSVRNACAAFDTKGGEPTFAAEWTNDSNAQKRSLQSLAGFPTATFRVACGESRVRGNSGRS
jgi:hypothetical protein